MNLEALKLPRTWTRGYSLGGIMIRTMDAKANDNEAR